MVKRALLALLLSSCAQEDLLEEAPEPVLDRTYFLCHVQPVITASCAFMACHGNEDRPLRLYAEQRYRLDVSWDDYEAPLTEAEIDANLQVLAGFVGGDSLLSEKPLDTRAGGLFHGARGLYGDEDVFASRDEPGYQALREFSRGATATDCAPEVPQ